MIYSVEVTENGFIEKLEIAGNIYYKKWINTDIGAKCQDDDFCEQIENDGIANEMILEKIYDVIDSSFFAFNVAEIEI